MLDLQGCVAFLLLPSPFRGLSLVHSRSSWLTLERAGYVKNGKIDKREKSHGGKRWYCTGDRGLRDKDDYFWFVGRDDDVITTSGYRVGPFECVSSSLSRRSPPSSPLLSLHRCRSTSFRPLSADDVFPQGRERAQGEPSTRRPSFLPRSS